MRREEAAERARRAPRYEVRGESPDAPDVVASHHCQPAICARVMFYSLSPSKITPSASRMLPARYLLYAQFTMPHLLTTSRVPRQRERAMQRKMQPARRVYGIRRGEEQCACVARGRRRRRAYARRRECSGALYEAFQEAGTAQHPGAQENACACSLYAQDQLR